jgi:hypothetical protein
MAQPHTEALGESVRANARADELERDRIAWNLPRGKVDQSSHRSDHNEPDALTPPKPVDSRR